MISGTRWESRRSLILSIAGSKPDWILLRKPQYEGSSDETKEEGTRKSETSDESLSQGVVDEQSMRGFRNMVKSHEDAKAEPEENTKSEDETKEEGTKKSETSDESLSQGVVDEQSIRGFRNLVKSHEDAKAESEEYTKSEDETGEGNKKTSAFTNYRPQGIKMQMKA